MHSDQHGVNLHATSSDFMESNVFSVNSDRIRIFDDQMLTPSSLPLKNSSSKNSPTSRDKMAQDCRGISSSVTILRPRSPTKCSTEERGLMEFVERGIKDSFNGGVPCPWEDIICAFSATFLFRSSSGAFIPDVDMQMYWCNFCSFKSKEKREMINHSMSHRFKCNYCDQECFTRFDVVKHSIKAHPEYKLTRHALKACMLLRDLLEQDETSIMFGGKNLDSDDKTDSLHLEYDQQSTNSNHGSSSGGDCQNSTPTILLNNQNESSLKVAGTFSIFPSAKRDSNDSSNDGELTVPLGMTKSGSLVELTQSLTESNSNGTNTKLFEVKSSETMQNTSTGPIALITNIQSNVGSSENNTDALQPLVTSTEETGLQIVDVQSSSSLKANIVTFSLAEENETGNFDGMEQQPAPQQNTTKETLQLLESLINPSKSSEKKNDDSENVDASPDVAVISELDSVQKTNLPEENVQTPKRKVAELSVDSSAEEDEDADPDYQPENKIGKSERSLRVKKKKLDLKSCMKEVSSEKKVDYKAENLPIGTQLWRCGYCRYRSLKKKKIEAHVKEKHSPKTIKYTRLIVNANKEIVKDSVSEKPLGQTSCEFEVKSSSSPPTIKTDVNDDEDGDDETNKEKYACMFCNYKSANVQIIRQHMFRLHPSKKFCCIDNFLKQKGKNFYTFFCCRHKCNFLSVNPQKYIEHVEKCTPLPKSGNDDGSKPTGLQQSVTFAQNLHDNEKVDGDRGSKKDSGDRQNYSCHRCSFSAIGNDTMKCHMLTEHPNLSMIALVKKPDSTLDFYLFCPEETCKFTTQRKHELEIHRKQTHMSKSSSIDNDDDSKDIKPFADQKMSKDGDPIEKNTMTYMPAYECLYCETSCISTSLMNMKRHVQETHPNEVVIVRDCVAYKRKRPSRIYVCDALGCIFNDLDYKEYLTHSIAHKGGILYGCANCNWAGQDKKDFNDHVKRQKGLKHSLVGTKVFMKEDGSIVKEDEPL